jgi:hypothetical protein
MTGNQCESGKTVPQSFFMSATIQTLTGPDRRPFSSKRARREERFPPPCPYADVATFIIFSVTATVSRARSKSSRLVETLHLHHAARVGGSTPVRLHTVRLGLLRAAALQGREATSGKTSVPDEPFLLRSACDRRRPEAG